MKRLASLASIALAFGVAASFAAPTADLTQPILLVAKPELGEFYRATVLLAVPAPRGQHVGLIINRPTPMTLARLFPDHAPSRLVTDPVYLGGPDYANSIFAVVRRGESPGGHSIALLADLYLAVDVETVDRIIEHEPQRARFFAGLVVWDPGELAAEIARGFWYVLEPNSDLVLRKSTQGMWEELARRAADAI